MRNDLVSRAAIFDSLVREYNRRYKEGERGLRLAWIEKAVNEVNPASEDELRKILKSEDDCK